MVVANGTFLLPGDEICVIEEALPGEGTAITDDQVFATITGNVFFDRKKRIVSIFPKVKKPVVPSKGDVIIGQAQSVSKHMVSLGVNYVNGEKTIPAYSALMHISQCSRDYLDSMYDAYKEGDILRGKIVDAHTIPFQFTTKYNELGVIFALCSKCGERLRYLKRGYLKCDNCGNVEKRKIAEDFGRARI
jgi:exosome complex component CSL4